MQLRVTPRRPLAPGVAEDLTKWSLAFLPRDAADVALQGKAESPFTLEGRPSEEFTYSYSAEGRRFTASVVVCNLNERERLTVTITARVADFKTVREEAVASLFSWDWQQ